MVSNRQVVGGGDTAMKRPENGELSRVLEAAVMVGWGGSSPFSRVIRLSGTLGLARLSVEYGV